MDNRNNWLTGWVCVTIMVVTLIASITWFSLVHPDNHRDEYNRCISAGGSWNYANENYSCTKDSNGLR